MKSVYLAATHLKMDRVVRQCAQHLLSSITVANSIETRSLPGIERDTELVKQIDAFIASNVSSTSLFLSIFLSNDIKIIEIICSSYIVPRSLCK